MSLTAYQRMMRPRPSKRVRDYKRSGKMFGAAFSVMPRCANCGQWRELCKCEAGYVSTHPQIDPGSGECGQ